jgi:hypothetical protein
MSEEREMRKLVEQTKRSADRLNDRDAHDMRRSSERRVREAAEEMRRRQMPDVVPDNLISDGSEEK